jgi:hypothetical protein
MKSISERRKLFMKHLCTILDYLDPSGENSKIYHDKLDKLSDAQFDKWATDFLNDPKDNIYLEIIEYERMVSMENIKKCAEYMKVPLFERVASPYLSDDDKYEIVTPEPVPVGYIHIKRMPQTLLKKSAGTISIEKRNAKTGQVTGADRNALNSDAETYSLAANGADYALKELMGPRADDMKAKAQLYRDISENGYVSLADIDNDKYSKTALNSMEVYFLMQGITTNLVTPLTELPSPK